MMADYIKREDVYDQLDRWARDLNNPQVYQRDDARCVIDGIPSADVAPVRHGRWIEHYKSDAPPTLKERWICSWCGNVQTYGITDYCPNCGAKMDEED